MPIQIFINALGAAGPIALMALGVSLAFCACRVFHVAQGAVFLAGPYAALAAGNALGYSPVVSGMVGLLASVVVGTATELVVYRPMRRARAAPLGMLLASFGALIVVQSGVALAFGSGAQSLRTQGTAVVYIVGGGRVSEYQLYSLCVSIGLALVVITFVRTSRLGLFLRAMVADDGLVTAFGVPRQYVVLVSVVLASVAGGLAGILSAYDTDLAPDIAFPMLLAGLTGAVVGNIARIEGAMLGGLLIGVAQPFIGWLIGAQWQESVTLGILVIALLLRPSGLWQGQLQRR